MSGAPLEPRALGAETACAYGKTTAHGDFVRVRANGEAGQRLQRFLHEAIDALACARADLPDETVFFVLPGAPGEHVAAGALRPSVDAVGRRFPLAVFAEVPPARFDGRSALLSVAASRFMARAAELLEGARSMDARTLGACVEALAGPSDADLAGARRLCDEALASASARELLERAFGDRAMRLQHDGVDVLLRAARGARAAGDRQAGFVLDCPIAIDVDVFAWLEIVERLLPGAAPAACAWTETTPRLRVAPRASSALFATLADSPGPAAGLRRLRASVPSAAPPRFSAELARILDGDGTLSDLVRAIENEGRLP